MQPAADIKGASRDHADDHSAPYQGQSNRAICAGNLPHRKMQCHDGALRSKPVALYLGATVRSGSEFREKTAIGHLQVGHSDDLPCKGRARRFRPDNPMPVISPGISAPKSFLQARDSNSDSRSVAPDTDRLVAGIELRAMMGQHCAGCALARSDCAARRQRHRGGVQERPRGDCAVSPGGLPSASYGRRRRWPGIF